MSLKWQILFAQNIYYMSRKETVEQFFKAKCCMSQYTGIQYNDLEKVYAIILLCGKVFFQFNRLFHGKILFNMPSNSSNKTSKYISYELDIFPQAKIPQNKDYSFCYLCLYERKHLHFILPTFWA